MYRTQTPVLIAIGANLPGPRGEPPYAMCCAAAEALRGAPGLRWSGQSPWYSTVPVPASDQPHYINGVVRLEGEIDPARLLDWLQQLEAAGGRTRSVANAPRSLDLDIIAMGGLVRDTPDPVLPHPRAHLRRFVLAPLYDVAPDWLHPRLKMCVRALLDQLADDGGCRILS